MNTHTDFVGSQGPRCHLKPCQIDGYCKEPAAHWVLILEPGMGVEPFSVMGCDFHAVQSVMNDEAEFVSPVYF
jgi:hypothetical protein